MLLTFHTNAAQRFDALAREVRESANRVEWPVPAQVSEVHEKNSLDPEVPITGTIGAADILGGIIEADTDENGAQRALRFLAPGKRVELEGEGYQALSRLVSQVQRTQTLRKRVSARTVQRLIFEWVVGEEVEIAELGSMTSYLLRKVQGLLARQSFVFPVFEVYAQESFTLGNVEFRTITESEMDEWLAASLDGVDTESRGVVLLAFDERRKRMQGRLAARITVDAEADYGESIAVHEAETSVALLRLVSAGIFLPRQRSYCALQGSETLRIRRHWRSEEGGRFRFAEAIVSNPIIFWRLDSAFIQRTLPLLAVFSVLVSKGEPSELEQELLTALLLYSEAALSDDVARKLTQIFISLESILLRSETEPIAYALSERVAFSVGQTADERLAIARDVKNAYGLRSRFVHHGQAVEDKDAVATAERFMQHAWNCFHNLAANSSRFADRLAILDALERAKFA